MLARALEPLDDERIALADELMRGFMARTGVSLGASMRRYLWTDAFAVCNLLTLAKVLRDPRYVELALKLVDEVHHTLGRHRSDDARKGWLSGLEGAAAEAHPTLGGLRIGKHLNERRADEPYNPRLEWDRDGQYFHYLTQWMHALDQVGRVTGERTLRTWARELARSSLRAFRLPGSGSPRLAWKMSIDLTRPLVPATGQLDAIEGYVTFAALSLSSLEVQSEPNLDAEVAELRSMAVGEPVVTADPLTVGSLLSAAYRGRDLVQTGALGPRDTVVDVISRSLLASLETGGVVRSLVGAPRHRLAFRELGLAIGLEGVRRMPPSALREGLAQHLPVADDILRTWATPANRRTSSWLEHEDINEVMLATALVPDLYLDLAPLSS